MVSDVQQIMAIEDAKFFDTVKEHLDHIAAMRQRRRWRDEYSVMHELRPVESVARNADGVYYIHHWRVTCECFHYENSLHAPDFVIPYANDIVTCITCLGTPEYAR